MTKIVLSHKDYERVLREGLDLDAYLQGRFDEAASDVKYLNEEVDVTIPISLDGARFGEALAKADETDEVEAAKSQALHAQFTADRAVSRVDELAARVEAMEHPEPLKDVERDPYPATSVTCESGRTYTVRDVVVFPETDDGEDVAIIVQVDSGADGFPARVYWEERRFAEWLSDDDFEGSFKIN